MSVWKLAVVAGCVCAMSAPAMAQVNSTSSRNAAAKAKEVAESEAEMAKLKLSKKAYIEEIAKSFDSMDTNKDGFVDAKEMSHASEVGLRDPNDPLDDSELDTPNEIRELQEFQARSIGGGTYAPLPATPASRSAAPQPVSPATGIPPINSDQLIQK